MGEKEGKDKERRREMNFIFINMKQVMTRGYLKIGNGQEIRGCASDLGNHQDSVEVPFFDTLPKCEFRSSFR